MLSTALQRRECFYAFPWLKDLAAKSQSDYDRIEYRMKLLCDEYDLDNPMEEPEEERS